MSKVTLYPHQEQVLQQTESRNRVAYYLDMGLGKTYVGSEKLQQLNHPSNLIVCQKSKIRDWVEHMRIYSDYDVYDLTDKKSLDTFLTHGGVGVINYDLVWRRQALKNFAGTLMLDESSMIQSTTAKRTKFILGMKPTNVILLSGTPTSGKYENLYSQLRLLSWGISKNLYWNTYIEYEKEYYGGLPYPIKKVVGYKNVDRLKSKLADHGAVFMKTEEVLDLPEQVENTIHIPTTREYRKFKRHRIVEVDGVELIGDTPLTAYLRMRQLSSVYNNEKYKAFSDILDSTEDRIIVFYSFTDELEKLMEIVRDHKRPISVINGQVKNLGPYETCDDSVTLIQYQAGAMGLNLQKANRIVYFDLTDRSELFEQSKKRIHRIGQDRTCFYTYLVTDDLEERIFETLKMRKDYNDELFERDFLLQ